MIPVAELRRFVRACDPSRPVGPTDPWYVDLDAGAPVRGEAGQSCAGQLLRTLQLAEPEEETCQLFTGFSGSGKTTELRKLEWLLRQDREVATHVVYIDYLEWLDNTRAFEIADVLRVEAYLLDRAATEAEGKDPDAAPGYIGRLLDLLSRDVEPKGLSLSAGAGSIMFELRENHTFREKVLAAIEGRFQQFVRDAQVSMVESVLRIRRATGAQRVVVIADSLERISGVYAGTRDAVERGAEAVFLTHARLLRLPCHVVYSFPSWLRHRTVGFGAHYDREPVVLPMIRITERDGRPYEAGLDKLVELVGRRIDIPRVFGDVAVLRPLLVASGGYPRDLLRMLRNALVLAQDFPLQARDVERVVSSLAQDYGEVIRSTDVDILAQVARTHDVPLGTAEDLQTFGELVERWLILTYRDTQRWYDVHPLVRRAPALQSRLKA